MSDLSKRITGIREMRGLSQREAAARVGWHPVRISHFETGSRTPSLGNLVLLCEALGCTPNELLGWDGGESSRLTSNKQ